MANKLLPIAHVNVTRKTLHPNWNFSGKINTSPYAIFSENLWTANIMHVNPETGTFSKTKFSLNNTRVGRKNHIVWYQRISSANCPMREHGNWGLLWYIYPWYLSLRAKSCCSVSEHGKKRAFLPPRKHVSHRILTTINLCFNPLGDSCCSGK